MLLGSNAGRFLTPLLRVDGQNIPIEPSEWRLISHWIPQFVLTTPAGTLECTYLTPSAQRGFAVRLEFRASRTADIELAFNVEWLDTLHVSDITKRMHGVHSAGRLPGPENCFYLGFRSAWPVFGVGLVADQGAELEMSAGVTQISEALPEISAEPGQPITGRFSHSTKLVLGEVISLTLQVGIGLEASGGVSCALHLRQQGWDQMLVDTQQWLDERQIECRGPAEALDSLLNENSLYNYFFSHGVTVDSERIVLTSSRSPRYDHTGSYRDRDCCLYSIPSVLLIDPPEARRMLEYAFNVQMRNVGARSRYLDGVPMQPGFSLDALAAPIRSLWMYVDLTDDLTILFDSAVQSGVNTILELMEANASEDIALYATNLAPAETPCPMKYFTYDNILVWRALVDLSDLYQRIRDIERAHETQAWAKDVRAAILDNCIVDGPYGAMFCRAVDLVGGADLGDDPEGSLILISHLEFCRDDFPPFKNTLRWVREQYQNEDANHRSLLVMANELLAGNREPLSTLIASGLDNGIACLSISPKGVAEKGPGWAAGAGYLSYCLVRHLEKYVTPPVLQKKEPRKTRISRTALRPGVGWI